MDAVLVACLASAMLSCTAAGVALFFSAPGTIRRQFRHVQARADEDHQLVADLRVEWKRYENELGSELEAVRDEFGRLERKRRSAAATVAKLGNEEPAEPQTRDQVRQLFRSRGM